MFDLVKEAYFELVRRGYTSSKVYSLMQEMKNAPISKIHIEAAVEPDITEMLSIAQLNEIYQMFLKKETDKNLEVFYSPKPEFTIQEQRLSYAINEMEMVEL